MSEAKQKAIQDAYGDRFEFLKPDEDGWCMYKQTGRHTFNGKTYSENGFSRDQVDVLPIYSNPPDYKWRPRSLCEIKNNNGWTRVDEKLPEITSVGLVYYCIEGRYFSRTSTIYFLEMIEMDTESNITHWKPAINPPDPIY